MTLTLYTVVSHQLQGYFFKQTSFVQSSTNLKKNTNLSGFKGISILWFFVQFCYVNVRMVKHLAKSVFWKIEFVFYYRPGERPMSLGP